MTDKGGLYVTEGVCAQRLGFTLKQWVIYAPHFQRQGMPLPCTVTKLRYWPAVQAFFDRHNGLAPTRPGVVAPSIAPDGEVNFNGFRSSKSQRAGAFGKAEA